MKLKKIRINNVLSYDNEEIEFNDDLNIFVGANGSGKSNLLNIIIYIMKRYLIKNYEISRNSSIEGNHFGKYYINEKAPIFKENEELFLRKHKALSRNSSISFDLFFEENDINNLIEIKKYKEEVELFVRDKVESMSNLDDPHRVDFDDILFFLSIDEKTIPIDKPITINLEEVNNRWIIRNNREEPYIKYMKYFSLLYTMLNIMEIDHSISNPFVFFEAYRNNDKYSTIASISDYEQNNYVNTQSFQNAMCFNYSIGTDSSFITLATKKFGELYRNYVEMPNGFELFNNDPQFKSLKEYFKKFKYDIKLECINPKNNVYQFYIIRDEIKIEMDTISSGEREIFNFIFGLFLDKIDGNIFIIDEPELHLHPKWQKKLINILKDETKEKNVQLFFVTHSSSFISYEILNNVFRIYMENGFSKIIKISDVSNSSSEFRKNLSVINATNNEKIFFCDNVILVEGITDEILLGMINEREKIINNDSLEFINMNGKDKLPVFENVLKKLNINYYFIGDYDNLNSPEHIKKIPILKKKFLPNTKKQVDDCINKSKKLVTKNLLNTLDKFVELDNPSTKEELIHNYKEFVDFFSDADGILSDEEEKIIEKYIESLYGNNIYFFKNGEIEDYLDIGNSKVTYYERVIDLYNNEDKYKHYMRTGKANELVNILTMINDKIMDN